MDNWIIGNILIDCRNTLDQINMSNGYMFKKNKYQDEITKNDIKVFFPNVDRYLNNIYSNMTDEELSKKTASPMSVSLGSGFHRCLEYFQNYYLTSILTGSITHILKSRSILIKILYKYCLLYNEKKLVPVILRLLVLDGNTKNLNDYYKILSDNFEIDMLNTSRELWDISANTCINQKEIRYSIIKTFGMYFDDEKFKEIVDFIKISCPDNFYSLDNYFKCVRKMMPRISPSIVIDILVDTLDNKKLTEGRQMADIILNLDITKVDKSKLIDFKKCINNHYKDIIDGQGTSQFIFGLYYQDKEMFNDLLEKTHQLMSNEDKCYYNINIKNNVVESYDNLLEKSIIYIENEIKNYKNGVFSSSIYSSLHSIKNVFINNQFSSSYEVMKKVYELLVKLLNAKNDVGIAEDIVDCLIEMTVVCKNNSIAYDFIKLDQDFNFSSLDYIMWDTATPTSIDIKIFGLRCLLGQVEDKEIGNLYYNYNSYSDYEKASLGDAIFKIFPLVTISQKKEFLHLLFIMASDDYFYVRCRALDCIPYISNLLDKNVLFTLIKRFSKDENKNVRVTLLNLCREKKISSELIDIAYSILKDDYDYEIRSNANN